jgi:hypothetical protein
MDGDKFPSEQFKLCVSVLGVNKHVLLVHCICLKLRSKIEKQLSYSQTSFCYSQIVPHFFYFPKVPDFFHNNYHSVIAW